MCSQLRNYSNRLRFSNKERNMEAEADKIANAESSVSCRSILLSTLLCGILLYQLFWNNIFVLLTNGLGISQSELRNYFEYYYRKFNDFWLSMDGIVGKTNAALKIMDKWTMNIHLRYIRPFWTTCIESHYGKLASEEFASVWADPLSAFARWWYCIIKWAKLMFYYVYQRSKPHLDVVWDCILASKLGKAALSLREYISPPFRTTKEYIQQWWNHHSALRNAYQQQSYRYYAAVWSFTKIFTTTLIEPLLLPFVRRRHPVLKIIRRNQSAKRTGDNMNSTEHKKKKSPRPLPDSGMSLTTEPCSLTWDDDPMAFRARMPCGHPFSAEAMQYIVKDTVENKGSVFRCPAEFEEGTSLKPCEYIWDYNLVRHVACFTEEEQQFYEKKLGELYLLCAAKAQQCPKCKNYCVREHQEHREHRVRCAFCNFEFCWACLHKWDTSGQKYCGNDECTGEDPRLRYLRQHPEQKKMGYTEVQSYAVRACPGCGFIIHHTTGCKQMRCQACKIDFCFVCLKPFDKEKRQWQCGSYNTKCEVAPMQTELPGGTEE